MSQVRHHHIRCWGGIELTLVNQELLLEQVLVVGHVLEHLLVPLLLGVVSVLHLATHLVQISEVLLILNGQLEYGGSILWQ